MNGDGPLALDLDYERFAELNAMTESSIEYRDLFSPHEDVPRALRTWAEERGITARGLVRRERVAGGMSQKLLFGLRDGYAIETVLIRRREGFTACVSSQVGCAFRCQFCASGQAGLKRNLTPGEIVEQVVRLGRKVNRIVFMGIGEPLNNYGNVLRAIRILRDRRGLDFRTTGITISTIGIPKALAALREEHLGINLTISLHATTDEVRGLLIPGARKHAIGEVVERALSWGRRHNRVVNLMRWNEVDGLYFRRIADRRLVQFRNGLVRAGIPAVVRDTQGNRIDAACGQLWLRDIEGLPVARAA
jgi:23S rRNA (adenine2503-C2)-methyltransferase